MQVWERTKVAVTASVEIYGGGTPLQKVGTEIEVSYENDDGKIGNAFYPVHQEETDINAAIHIAMNKFDQDYQAGKLEDLAVK